MKTKFTLLSAIICVLLQVSGLQAVLGQAPVTISYAGSPYNFMQGVAIKSITPVVSGTGPFKYIVSPALPGGLTLDSASGVISGTPAAVTASATYSITCTGASGLATTAVKITVVATPPAVFYSGSPYTLRVYDFANILPTVSGTTPIRFSIYPSLPAGLRFNTSTGAITGSAITLMDATIYSVSASNSGGFANTSVQIVIGDQPLVYYSNSSYTFTMGEAITTIVPQVSGGGPYSYSINPALPAGISIDQTTGAIQGTPASVSANTAYTITCKNPFGSRSTALNIQVQAPQPPNSFSYTTPKVLIRGGLITPLAPGRALNVPVVLSYGIRGVYGVAADTAGNVYAAEYESNIVCKISKDAYSITTIGTFSGPTGVAYDAKGSLYVVENTTGDVVRIGQDGSRVVFGGLEDPIDLAVDGAGNMYVAERGPSRLTKIAPDGSKTTLGQGINKPCGVDIDSAGNLYTAEYTGTVKKISKDGVTTVIAGGGSAVAVDRAGNVFIAGNNNVIKLSPDGSQVSVGAISEAFGLATDADGSVYAADYHNSAVFKISTGPKVQSYRISPGLPAGFLLDTATGIISGTPTALTGWVNYTITAANKGGNKTSALQIAVADPITVSYPGSPYRYTQGTAITSLSPVIKGTGPFTFSVSPSLPAGITIDEATGIINGTPTAIAYNATYIITCANAYVSDTAMLTIEVKEPPAPGIISYATPPVYIKGKAVTPLVPQPGVAIKVSTIAYGFQNNDYAMAVGKGHTTWYVDAPNQTLYKVDPSGNITGFSHSFESPHCVVVDTVRGFVYVGDSHGNNTVSIDKFKLDGTFVSENNPGLTGAWGMAVDTAGNIYVADAANTVAKLKPDFSTVWAKNYFNQPMGVAVDSAGNVYVAELQNTSIHKLNPDATVLSSVGSAIYGAYSVAFDRGGNLYVTEPDSNLVKKITPAGVTTTIAILYNANKMSVDADGSIFVTDINDVTNSYGIRKIVTDPTVTYSITPSLPAGLTLNKTTGILSGTPAAASAQATYTIKAANSSGSRSASVQITVGAPPTVSYAASPYTFTQGVAITTVKPVVSGDTLIKYTISPKLPAGLSFDSTTGVIKGTPTVATAKATYTVTATNIYGKATATLSVEVAGPLPPAGAFTLAGQQGYTANRGYFPCSAVDTAGNVYTTYIDTISQRVKVVKYDGAKWAQVGDSSSISAGPAAYSSIGIYAGTNIYVAYFDLTGSGPVTGNVVVKKLAGTAWVQVGSTLTTNANVKYGLSFAVSQLGTLGVAVINAANYRVTAYTQQNGTWATLTPLTSMAIPKTAPSGTGISYHTLNFGPDNTPYIAVNDTTATLNVFKYTTKWALAGKALTTKGTMGYWPSLAINSTNGTSYASFSDAKTLMPTCLKFDTTTTTWVAAGATAVVGTHPGTYPVIAMNRAGVPNMSFIDSGYTGPVSVMRLISNSWVYLGGKAGVSPGSAVQQSLALSNTGITYVTYSDAKVGNKLSTIRFDTLPITNNIVTYVKTGCGVIDSAKSTTPVGGIKPYTYQWQSSMDSLNYTAIAGQTGATLKYTSTNILTATTYFRRVVNPGQGSSTSNVVTYAGKPSINITANTATTICNKTTVTFTANAANGGAGFSYRWVKNKITVGDNSATYIDSTLKTGDSVLCVLKMVKSCVMGDSLVSNKLKFTINQVVVPQVYLHISPNDTICAGTKVTFSDSVSNIGTSKYIWMKNGVVVGDSTNKYIDSTLKNKDTITTTVSSTLACVTARTVTEKVVMTVNTRLTPAISIAASAVSICTNTKVSFTATATSSGANPVYQWKKNNKNVGTNSITYADSTLNDKDSIVCVITTTSGCTNTSATSNKVKITVNPNLIPSVTILPIPNDTICTGTKVTFAISATNIGAGKYQWTKNGKVVGDTILRYVDSSLNNGDTIATKVSSIIGCVTVRTVTDKVVMTVNPLFKPTITITASKDSICAGTAVTYTSVATNAGASPMYQWTKNNVNVGTNSSTYTDNALKDKDSIRCYLTTTALCTYSSATSNQLKAVVEAVTPMPSAITGLSSVKNGTKTTYSVGTIRNATYVWTFPASVTIVSGAGTRQIVVIWGNTVGTVSVRAIDNCGTSDASTLNVSLATSFTGNTGSKKPVGDGMLKAYPNPSTGPVTVNFTAASVDKYEVQVTDGAGKLVLLKAGQCSAGVNYVGLNLEKFAQGTYYVRLIDKQHALRAIKVFKISNPPAY